MKIKNKIEKAKCLVGVADMQEKPVSFFFLIFVLICL